MVTLRRIGVFSAGRVGFFFGIASSVTNISVALFMLVVFQGVPISVIPAQVWLQIGLSILVSSLILSVAVGMFAFIYNLNSNIGGLKLEFEMSGGSLTKRKNDDLYDESDDDDVIEID